MSEPRAHLHTVDQIVDMMRPRIVELVRDVWQLRDGYEERNDWVCLNPLRADRKKGSFRICLRGSYRGMVKDFAGGGQTWTPLSFTAALLFNGDQSEALRWARAWLGLDGRDPEAFRKTRAAVAAVADEPADDAGEKWRGTAHRRYLEAQDNIVGTPVDAYLRGRGLDVRRLSFPLRAVRFHPALHNTESGRAWPAMVASINDTVTGKFLGLHRTWLEVRADGRVTKAPLAEPKKTLGGYRGGTIRLWAGIRVDGGTGEIRKNRKLRQEKGSVWVDLTEGIEDGLSVAIAMEELRVHVGVSVSNMQAIRWPDQVAGITLWQQNDEPGSPAALGAARIVEAYRGQGKRVKVALPPEGFKDVNAWVQAMTMDREAAAHGG